ncbi:ParB/RepB/Spo0J family partition protein [Roseovarius atlanticus]|uniref:ParB/RepB/Spo0J family partition protein n=1 Tax=Roseovarius atlanticus TaxID=1641875 RepID=UPI001C95BD4C|nr:ParB/RepB/Spo0J family partition protein [Roseovarius atlanticus]MBY5987168.1 ParB/RepB/Spo0J family partition protein [Roseovarius atlanticus]MBY6125808.1 ParB/RepB/Spo0J family partition protein [Roseovarius atlanticus]MBY6149731.1 ParB/RepB/Spo0J family partition protein [Roseovarius atlanticus]
MSDKKSKRGLGRGLSALMSDVAEVPDTSEGAVKAADKTVPIERIEPNPDQPRRDFDEDALRDLAASISEKGIIQPLIVRPSPRAEHGFEIVAGERRWRAAQLAKLHQVPVIIREFDDTEVLEVAIIENVQRADLNPVEEAAGYSQLMERFGHTQEKLAQALGKSRSHIANLVRLLSLPDDVQRLLRDGKLSSGHARALITADNPSELAQQVVKKGLSVRETEKLAKKAQQNIFSDGSAPKKKNPVEKDADTKALEGDLSANLGMKVALNHRPGQENGSMTISYESLDQLDDLCRKLAGN